MSLNFFFTFSTSLSTHVVGPIVFYAQIEVWVVRSKLRSEWWIVVSIVLVIIIYTLAMH